MPSLGTGSSLSRWRLPRPAGLRSALCLRDPPPPSPPPSSGFLGARLVERLRRGRPDRSERSAPCSASASPEPSRSDSPAALLLRRRRRLRFFGPGPGSPSERDSLPASEPCAEPLLGASDEAPAAGLLRERRLRRGLSPPASGIAPKGSSSWELGRGDSSGTKRVSGVIGMGVTGLRQRGRTGPKRRARSGRGRRVPRRSAGDRAGGIGGPEAPGCLAWPSHRVVRRPEAVGDWGSTSSGKSMPHRRGPVEAWA